MIIGDKLGWYIWCRQMVKWIYDSFPAPITVPRRWRNEARLLWVLWVLLVAAISNVHLCRANCLWRITRSNHICFLQISSIGCLRLEFLIRLLVETQSDPFYMQNNTKVGHSNLFKYGTPFRFIGSWLIVLLIWYCRNKLVQEMNSSFSKLNPSKNIFLSCVKFIKAVSKASYRSSIIKSSMKSSR